MYTLSTQIYLDTYEKTYRKILIINKKPPGMLSKHIRQISLPKLSPFKTNDLTSYCDNQCVFALTKFCNNTHFMDPNDIPDLFTFLMENDYTINTQLTQMMQTSNVKMDKEIICFIGI